MTHRFSIEAQAPPTFTPDSEFAELETPRGPAGGSLSISALARFEFEAGKGMDEIGEKHRGGVAGNVKSVDSKYV
jgi:hypothetical protein